MNDPRQATNASRLPLSLRIRLALLKAAAPLVAGLARQLMSLLLRPRPARARESQGPLVIEGQCRRIDAPYDRRQNW